MDQVKEYWHIAAGAVAAFATAVWYIATQETRIKSLEIKCQGRTTTDANIEQRLKTLELDHREVRTKLNAIDERTESIQDDIKTLIRRSNK